MLTMPHSRFRRGSVAVLSVEAALLFSLILHPLLSPNFIALFLIAVIINVWYGGAKSGLFTTLLSTVAYYLLITAYWQQMDILNATQLCMFIVVAMLISVLFEVRQRSEETVYQQNQKFQATLASIGEAVVTTDGNGLITLINHAAETLLGWSPTEIIGKNISDIVVLISSATRQPIENPVRQALREGRNIKSTTYSIVVSKDGTHRAVDHSSAPIKDSAGHIIGAVLIVHDMTEYQRDQEAHRFLAEASIILGSSLDYETTLQAVARLLIPRLADWCAVEIIGQDSTMQQVVVAHIDPAKVALAQAFRKRFPPDPQQPGPLSEVISQSKSQLIPEISEELLRASAQHPDQFEMARALALKSSMLVPIIGYNGVLGVITFVSAESGRRYDENDLALAEELARRIALALQNSRLYHEAHQARQEAERVVDRVTQIQIMTDALSATHTVSQIGDLVVNRGLTIMGASAGLVMLLTGDKTSLEVISAAGYKSERLAVWQHFPISLPTPVGDAIRTGQPIWLGSLEKRLALYPNYPPPEDQQAWAAIPLIVEGETIGAIGLGFMEAQEFSAKDQAFILLLAQKCARTIDRARLFEAEQIARKQAEIAQIRLALLAQINMLLVSTMGTESRLNRIAHSVLPLLGDWCVIDLLEKDGVVRSVAIAATDAAKEVVLRDMYDQYPIDVHSLPPSINTLWTGELKFFPTITDKTLVEIASDENQLALLRKLGYGSMMVVPLVTREQSPLGAITFVYAESGRCYTTDDLALAEEIARRVGLAIDNAYLYHAAQAQRQQLQVTLASIGDAVIATDTQGRITFMNPMAETLTGWTFEQAANLLLRDVFRIVNETTHAPVESPVTKVLRENRVVGLANHTLLIAKDGTERPVDDSGAPIRDENGAIIGIILVFRDVTERRHQESALNLTLERTQDLYETCRQIGLVSSPDEAVQALLTSRYIAHTAQCAVLTFNTPWKDARPDSYEITASSPVGKPLPGFPDNGRLQNSPFANLISCEHPVLIADTQTDERLDPAARDLFAQANTRSLMIFPLLVGRRCFGLLLLYFTTPQHWSEEDYRHLQVFIEQVCVTIDNFRLFTAEARARLEAERANQIKLRFLAMISHELRTPLTSIKGFATTLLATDVEWTAENQRNFITIISEESDKLTDLIEQLLDLSRLQAGQLRIQPERRSFSAIMDTAMAQLDSLTAQHQLVLNIPPDLPSVMADTQRIAEVLVNLVGNAAKYAPPHTLIAISAAAHDHHMQVDVSDEGPGIPPENREKVFEAFEQLENVPLPQTKGIGLGLAICKGLIEAQGGKIWIADTSVGTTVSFTLPVAPA